VLLIDVFNGRIDTLPIGFAPVKMICFLKGIVFIIRHHDNTFPFGPVNNQQLTIIGNGIEIGFNTKYLFF
jgi:hypothetical protein